jgi:hypothetical protein
VWHPSFQPPEFYDLVSGVKGINNNKKKNRSSPIIPTIKTNNTRNTGFQDTPQIEFTFFARVQVGGGRQDELGGDSHLRVIF